MKHFFFQNKFLVNYIVYFKVGIIYYMPYLRVKILDSEYKLIRLI